MIYIVCVCVCVSVGRESGWQGGFMHTSSHVGKGRSPKAYVCVEEGTTGGSKTRFKLRRYFTISFQCFLDDFRRYWMIAQRRNWLSSNNKWAKAKNVQNWYNYSGLLHFHNLVCYSFYNNLIKFIFVNRYHKEVI